MLNLKNINVCLKFVIDDKPFVVVTRMCIINATIKVTLVGTQLIAYKTRDKVWCVFVTR